jgi:hypothetical protein
VNAWGLLSLSLPPSPPPSRPENTEKLHAAQQKRESHLPHPAKRAGTSPTSPLSSHLIHCHLNTLPSIIHCHPTHNHLTIHYHSSMPFPQPRKNNTSIYYCGITVTIHLTGGLEFRKSLKGHSQNPAHLLYISAQW